VFANLAIISFYIQFIERATSRARDKSEHIVRTRRLCSRSWRIRSTEEDLDVFLGAFTFVGYGLGTVIVGVLLELKSTDRLRLGVLPLLNLVLFSIQKSQFPALEEHGQQKETGWDTEEGHEGEGNRDLLDIHDNKHSTEEDNLDDGVLVDLVPVHVLGELGLRVAAWLLEKEEETVPEFNSRKGGETHEKEDSIEDRKRQELQGIQEEHAKTKEEVGEEHGQSCFLDADDVAVAIFVGKGAQVDHAWNSCGNQPRKSQQSIDAVENTVEEKIVVVGFTVAQLVVLVVDQVPSDTVIQVAQKESHDSRSGGSKRSPCWNISKRDKPFTGLDRGFLSFTLIGPESITSLGTALEGGFKSVGYI